MTTASPPKLSRQARSRSQLLKAATKLFSTYGFRHTTMEAIAHEAQVAKATAYAYFPNKEEAFGAVIKQVGLEFLGRAEAAAALAKTPEAAVLASLSTKQLAVFELVHSSAHAAELLDAIARDRTEGYESVHTLYINSLTKLLKRCHSVSPRQAANIATMLDHAAYGLSSHAANAAELKARLELLIDRVVRGE